jgi:hypothetical protein
MHVVEINYKTSDSIREKTELLGLSAIRVLLCVYMKLTEYKAETSGM